MRMNLYLVARLGILVGTLALMFKGYRGEALGVLAFLSGIAVCTFFGPAKPPIDRNSHPKKRALDYGMSYYVGTQQEFLNYLGGWDIDAEAINWAAIRHPSGLIFAVDQCGRHHHCIEAMAREGYAYTHDNVATKDQGFVTSEGRYVDRRQGLKIARLAGQIPLNAPKRTNPQNLLFSDDIWFTPPGQVHANMTAQGLEPNMAQPTLNAV